MSKGPKITVAGAGALGLTTALALADAGARVTVFDAAQPGDNASGVAAGMLAPAFEAVLDPSATPHFSLLMAARNLWPALEARIGLTVDRAGAVAVGDDDFLAGIDGALRGLGLHPTELERGALAGTALIWRTAGGAVCWCARTGGSRPARRWRRCAGRRPKQVSSFTSRRPPASRAASGW